MNAKNSQKINTFALILALAFVTGCGTVAPKTNESTHASYDRQDTVVATSGILGFAPTGRVVSEHYKERYNSLIDLYGDQFNPPLKHDEGIVPNSERIGGFDPATSYVIDREHHVKMGQMIQWKRDGRLPTSGFKKLLNKVL